MNIEVGQVWTLKYNAEPVCVVNIQDGFIYIDWFWENGINDCDGITIEHFLRDYEFYAQPIAYHDFKKWCMTRQNPVKQSEPIKQKVYEIGIFDRFEGGGRSRLFRHDVAVKEVREYLLELISRNLPELTEEELENEYADMKDMVLTWRKEIQEKSNKVKAINSIQDFHRMDFDDYEEVLVIEREIH